MRALTASVVVLTMAMSGGVAVAQEEEPAPGIEATAPSEAPGPFHGFFFRVGVLALTPVPSSSEVSLENVEGPARLSVSNGPIAGSSVGLGSNVMPAGTIGWTLPFLDRRLSVETVIAVPFTLKLSAGGTLATRSLAPTALGSLPTGLPALGTELGEVKVLPPVLTATWRFGPFWRVRPYLGAGFSYLVTLEARITNKVLTEASTPTLSVPNSLAFVLQGGTDVHLWKSFYATFDFKYLAGLDLTAKVKDVSVRLPKLPLYDVVRVGDNSARVTVNPLVFQLGVGMDL